MRALIAVSFIAAFMLSVVELDGWWSWLRPEFAPLLLLYWSVFCARYFGLGCAWFVGLGMDLLFLYPLGFHALGTLLIACIALLAQQRIRNATLPQQVIWVFALIAVFQLFCYWLGGFFHRSADIFMIMMPAFISSSLWPLLVIGLARVRVYYQLFD